MQRKWRRAVALGLAGALTIAAATPSFARGGRNAAAAIGFAAGALIGAAAANAAARNTYDAPGYAYYGADDYAYAGPGYYAAPVYAPRSCWRYTDRDRGLGYNVC